MVSKRRASPGLASTSTFTSLIRPARSVASCSRAGLTMRQGPHQVAHRSTSTGTGDRSATSPKSASPASVIHGRCSWQFPHLGRPSPTAGTRLRFPQCGQVTTVLWSVPAVIPAPPPAPCGSGRRG